jgi:hypothetical protein
VSASLEGVDAVNLVGRPIVLQQWSGGIWSDWASKAAKADGPVRFTFAERAAITVRVAVPAAGLTSPAMVLPAAPARDGSRYYVRSYRKGTGVWIVRVFQDGVAYGISHRGWEYSCLAGSLAEGLLTLTTFDFGGEAVALAASGTWDNLKIRDTATKPVKGARKSLSGRNRTYLTLCAAPTYAFVSTHPQ